MKLSKPFRELTKSLLSFGMLLSAPAQSSAADAITHQIALPSSQAWCSDTMINGLFSEINAFRTRNGQAALGASAVGAKDAEMRASQFATYMRTTPAGSPGFNPHQGYDTTAAALGYNLVSENLAYISTDPAYIVNGLWQDSLHLAALLAPDANVMGVSCVYDGGTAFWAYEPGACTGSGCASSPQPAPTPAPAPAPGSGPPALDSEEWAFLTLINNYRAQNGLGGLQVSAALESAAKWMSADMAAMNYFSHTDSLGRSTGARIAAFGYTYTPWGENLAAGYADAQSAFDQWRTACDPDASGACTYAHRRNMLAPGFTAIGIARAPGGGYGWYWTTDFGGYVEQNIPAPGTTASVPSIGVFSASPSNITGGQSSVLAWTVTGATSISIDNGVGNVAAGGSKTVSPAQTTTYTLTATNSVGAVVSKVTIVVGAAGDTQPPSAPALNSATVASSTQVDLTWSGSTDNVGVSGYQVLRNGAVIATVSSSTRTYADTGVSGNANYVYSVRAIDAAGNTSQPSNTIQVLTPAVQSGGAQCPAPATDAFTGCYYSNTTLSGTPAFVRTDAQINFDWGGNTPDRAVARGSFSVRWQGNFTFAQDLYTFAALTSDGMRLYIDGTLVMDRWYNQSAMQHTTQQSLSKGSHLVAVEYYEATGWSVAHLTWKGGAATVQPPVILSFAASPASLTAGQSATLTWSANGAATLAIDNGVGDVAGASSKTVAPSQTTTYTLTAANAAGSVTSKATVTVGMAQDIQPPAAPALLSADPQTSGQIKLVWSASVDNVGIAGYQILRNGAAIGSVMPAALTYVDSGVSPGSSYAYSVKAFDAAANYSGASNVIQASLPAVPQTDGWCPGVGVGVFIACYYSNAGLSGAPTLIRTDPQINFDWGGNPPDRLLPRGAFSTRWQGSFSFAEGVYSFSATTSDGMRIYIDGKLVLDRWNDQSVAIYTFQQPLSAGPHRVDVDYYERTGWSAAHLSWQKN